jgi:hypothetical protein
MPTVSSEQQLPPADELFDVRAEIKHLTSRERELKALMIGDPSTRTGNHYICVVRDIETARLDVKELKAAHADIVGEYTHVVTDKRVELRAITDDGEIVAIKRVRHEAV